MKPTVYLESSVISYCTARPSRDLVVAARQQITRQWWDTARPDCDLFISAVVVSEIARGDWAAASERSELVSRIPLLTIVPEVRDLAEHYLAELSIPGESRPDAFHLALASWHGMDYLLTWNCRHIANARVRRVLEEVNADKGIRTPTVCTPEELLEA